LNNWPQREKVVWLRVRLIFELLTVVVSITELGMAGAHLKGSEALPVPAPLAPGKLIGSGFIVQTAFGTVSEAKPTAR